jgi:hypothetical protein
MYLISMFSSSFIEEEHQIWYYFVTTQLFLLVYAVAFQNRQSVKRAEKKEIFSQIKLIGGLLLFARIMRYVNQTGNKWLHVIDIGDILKQFVLLCSFCFFNYSQSIYFLFFVFFAIYSSETSLKFH